MILLVTAVPAERDAIADALARSHAVPHADVELGPYRAQRLLTAAGVCDVVSVGPGPVVSAAATAYCLSARTYRLVISAGIAGAYEGWPHPPGSGPVVVADRVVLDRFGAEGPDGFLPSPQIGLGACEWPLVGADSPARQGGLVREAVVRTAGVSGAIVTVLDATGAAATATRRASEWRATAEAMEGAGALAAARQHGVLFLEVRAISNLVGPRDWDTWDIPGALAVLGRSVAALLARPLPEVDET